MILKAFTIYDSKAEAFLPPFFCPTAAVALRDFESAINTESHAFHKYAADYTLFELADWDPSTGKFTPHATPLNLGVAITLLQSLAPSEGPGAQHSNITKISN